jgi:Cytochrome c
MRTVSLFVFAAGLLSAVACTGDQSGVPSAKPVAAAKETATPSAKAKTPFRIPAENEITDSVTLASVRRGRALIHSTRDSLPTMVRATLNCSNCHIADGTQKDGMPLVGAYARFPQYRARSAKVDLIEDRINDCFVRSMNGKALSPQSAEMHDMVAYLAFLSRGFPVGVEMEGQGTPALDTKLKGDTTRGQRSLWPIARGATASMVMALPLRRRSGVQRASTSELAWRAFRVQHASFIR